MLSSDLSVVKERRSRVESGRLLMSKRYQVWVLKGESA